jgi:prepilin-type processing-associated H-X9-DG protein
MRDKPGFDASTDARYGSRHAKGFTMAMCDGSVRTIAYPIAAAIHRDLGDRKDGRTVQVP